MEIECFFLILRLLYKQRPILPTDSFNGSFFICTKDIRIRLTTNMSLHVSGKKNLNEMPFDYNQCPFFNDKDAATLMWSSGKVL